MARDFGPRIHFAHLRNTTREADGSFYEAEHLDGDTDMIGVVAALRDLLNANGRMEPAQTAEIVRQTLSTLVKTQRDRDEALAFIARELSRYTYVSLMSQYFPAHRAPELAAVSRRITPEEYRRALDWADELGLRNVFAQDEGDHKDRPRIAPTSASAMNSCASALSSTSLFVSRVVP